MNNLNIYKTASNIETDKNKLVLLLFEELLKSLFLIKKTEANDIEFKVNKINHCLDIFDELKNSIHIIKGNQKSEDMGFYLEGLYNQQIINLYDFSKSHSDEKILEIITVVKGLIEVWNTIVKQ